MPRGNPSPKMAITVPPDVHTGIIEAAAEAGVSVSAWITSAVRVALKRETGLAAIREYEKEFGKITEEEIQAALAWEDAQIKKALAKTKVRRSA